MNLTWQMEQKKTTDFKSRKISLVISPYFQLERGRHSLGGLSYPKVYMLEKMFGLTYTLHTQPGMMGLILVEKPIFLHQFQEVKDDQLRFKHLILAMKCQMMSISTSIYLFPTDKRQPYNKILCSVFLFNTFKSNVQALYSMQSFC